MRGKIVEGMLQVD